MEWYRVLIILVGISGIILALVNWWVNNVDIPNGLLTILSIIISGALGPDAIAKLTGKDKKETKPELPEKKEEKVDE